MADWLRDLRENWNDHYWRADHPEVAAIFIAIATGVLGLLFAYLQARITKSVATREN
jgi:hypothetical protein